MKGTLALGATGLALGLAACSLLVEFEDRPVESPDGGEPAAEPTATATATTTTPRPDSGVVPGPDASGPFTCAGKDNVAVPFKADTACCQEKETPLTGNLNCGGCGIECITGQSCQRASNFHYYCTGCGNTGGRTSCWSECCSAKYGPIGICAPNDCDTGACVPANCTIRGMKCVEGTTSSASYCEY